jgi:ABC-type lipoprotein release transport system permease subunit
VNVSAIACPSPSPQIGVLRSVRFAYNSIADSGKQPSWDTLAFTVLWLSLGVIFVAVYAIALATTFAPALRASRVYPAEALRYR